MKMEKQEIRINKPFAEIRELHYYADTPNKNELRIYCSQSPNTWTIQVRTHKPITYGRTGKPRDMIAHCTVTIAELEEILATMKEFVANQNENQTI